MLMGEIEEIKQRFEKREKDAKTISRAGTYDKYFHAERENVYQAVLRKYFKDFKKIKFLEIGAGGGRNLAFFNSIGIPYTNIYANELLDNRIELLRRNIPGAYILPGDAMELNFINEFDVVFQSTVFTSILDNEFRKKLANKMWEMTKQGGLILWYDFIYNNPNNPDVRKVGVNEIKRLFHHSDKIKIRKVTLAPPIGRRVGKLYPFFSLFPFLKTHVIAVINKS